MRLMGTALDSSVALVSNRGGTWSHSLKSINFPCVKSNLLIPFGGYFCSHKLSASCTEVVGNNGLVLEFCHNAYMREVLVFKGTSDFYMHLCDLQERLSDIHGKVDKTRQVLEGEIQRRQQLKKDLETIRMWVVKIEVLINSKLTKHEEVDEREIKVKVLLT